MISPMTDAVAQGEDFLPHPPQAERIEPLAERPVPNPGGPLDWADSGQTAEFSPEVQPDDGVETGEGAGLIDNDTGFEITPIPPPPSGTIRYADSVYIVTGVNVSATAETATEARNAAQSSGRAQAIDILLRRLTAEEDWVYLPKLGLDQAADAATLIGSARDENAGEINAPLSNESNRIVFSPKQAVLLTHGDLTTLEEGFAVFDEKSSRTSYRATITYRFKKADIGDLLTRAGLPFSDSQSRTALIIPVLQTQNGLYLWEHNNPWAQTWLTRPLINELTPMLLPAGDITDTNLISAEDALNLSPEAIAKLARRYEVAQVIVAQADLSRRDEQFRLRVRLRNGYLAGALRPQNNIASSATSSILYDDTPGISDASAVLLETWYYGDDTDFPALARRAVESTVAKYASGWKKQTIVDHSVQTQITLQAYFSDIKEWNLIRNALDQSPLIAGFSTGLLGTSGTTIKIQLLGSTNQLILAMQQRGLVVWSSGETNWNIASSKTASPVRASNIDTVSPGRPLPQNDEGSGASQSTRELSHPGDTAVPDKWRPKARGGSSSQEEISKSGWRGSASPVEGNAAGPAPSIRSKKPDSLLTGADENPVTEDEDQNEEIENFEELY